MGCNRKSTVFLKMDYSIIQKPLRWKGCSFQDSLVNHLLFIVTHTHAAAWHTCVFTSSHTTTSTLHEAEQNGYTINHYIISTLLSQNINIFTKNKVLVEKKIGLRMYTFCRQYCNRQCTLWLKLSFTQDLLLKG